MSGIIPHISLEAYDDAVEALRETEYPMLKDSVYLDHAGSTLPSKSLMEGFAQDMTSSLLGNPHSASTPSQQSTARIENIRLRLLGFLGADPNDFDVVFVANATAGVKLVVEGMRSLPHGFLYAHHQACHTSLVGPREEAAAAVCLDDAGCKAWQDGVSPFQPQDESASATLMAYTGQSHFDGRRYPLGWSSDMRRRCPGSLPKVYTLVDAASLAATSPLDLSDPDLAPDFTVLSLYKIFGFPDLGALIVRHSADAVFSHRKYFGGGTVDMVVCGQEQWHAHKSEFLHERLEDGTLPFHNIMALDTALDVHSRLFGTMKMVSKHTHRLSSALRRALSAMRHGNGAPVCRLYTSGELALDQGPNISFNIMTPSGAYVSLPEFDKLALLKKMHVRTGTLCSPCGAASALELAPWEMKRNFSAGLRCGGTDSDLMAGKPTGVIRVSFGAMSTQSDVDRFINFVKEFFVELAPRDASATPTVQPAGASGMRVKAITIFPIKSCAGLVVPPATPWEIRPEGLAWDREWCLVHKGSGQTLSQKRYPQMALLKPTLNLTTGMLRVEYRNKLLHNDEDSRAVDIPLSMNPALFEADSRQIPTRVCGEQFAPYIYSSKEINDFFSDSLGVPCALTRFPAARGGMATNGSRSRGGGRVLSSRATKARMQLHQQPASKCRLPGSFPDIPSPPDSDSERHKDGKILLANESPILMIHSGSVSSLNKEIVSRGGSAVDESTFRANIILESRPGAAEPMAPYSEDHWQSLQIGAQHFNLLGACRRCQMVCVDQGTGAKSQEPFSTLAKTRRFNGKVFFGCHMCHDPRPDSGSYPTVSVGDLVKVDQSP